MSVWSNIAYVIAGLSMMDTPVIGISMMLLGATSAMAHYKGGQWWNADWAFMYATFTAIALYNFGIEPALAVSAGAFGYTWGMGNYYAFGILFAVTILSAFLAGIAIALPLVIFAVALACQRYAEQHRNTRTYETYHSVWHVLTAIAMTLI